MDDTKRDAHKVAADMLADLDVFIDQFQAWGWFKAAANAEELVCEIYNRLGVAMPAERSARIEALLDQDPTRTSST